MAQVLALQDLGLLVIDLAQVLALQDLGLLVVPGIAVEYDSATTCAVRDGYSEFDKRSIFPNSHG